MYFSGSTHSQINHAQGDPFSQPLFPTQAPNPLNQPDRISETISAGRDSGRHNSIAIILCLHIVCTFMAAGQHKSSSLRWQSGKTFGEIGKSC